MAKRLFITCQYCGQSKPASAFLKSKSEFFPCGTVDICTECIEDFIEHNNANFNYLDKLCRWLDIPFIPERWVEYYEVSGPVAISTYVETIYQESYPMLDWKKVNDGYTDLKNQERLDETMPQLKEEKMRKLRAKWGEEYEDTEIRYMEDLFQGILQTQNVNGKLQTDDAEKLCKISLLINRKIRDGEDFDKLLKSYDTLRKGADFTPKNIKNACDFDSVGELFMYCEKKGWENAYYDNTPRDTVDLVMKDVQNWLRNLYKNETGIAEDVERRINALKIADDMESTIMAVEDDGLDDFDAEAYDMESFDEGAGL
jgi:hypothetical protein